MVMGKLVTNGFRPNRCSLFGSLSGAIAPLSFFAGLQDAVPLGRYRRIRHTTKADSGITLNGHNRSIGKHQLIERHVRRF